ncbi:MAG: bifunctional homocysteine S-methyltransferase/methylenetetrahydrofolate reductase [Acidobacteria bacterium]|nr:bifunctional homocysteine S-methyltransferase/methylenetetrahydrofolate reductase [Acidobacteriota bacterium]
MSRSILERLDDRVLVCDGAMGTMLYGKGIFINKCFDELNLSAPHIVRDIHTEYLQVGVDIIETNTFGANPLRLHPHGLEEKIREINIAGARIAREAVGNGGALVAGSVGPLGVRIEPWGKISVDEAAELFKRQVGPLLDGGVDLFILETFFDLNEIRAAILAVKSLCDLPIVAQMTLEDDGNNLEGTSPEAFTLKIDEWGADVVGCNCSVGPAVMLDSIERMSQVTGKKLSAQPNAGKPRNVEGRTIYLCSPEYMASYARRFIQVGVRLVGGCCGTTPDHIKAIKSAVRSLQPGSSRVTIAHPIEREKEVTPVPLAEKSLLGKKIAEGQFAISVEIVPPKGCDPAKTIASARFLKERGVDAVNIPDGPRASARMSALLTATLCLERAGIEPILHYTCRDRNILGIQSDLLGAYAIGLRNILAVTGDPPKMGDYPDATAVFDIDSIGLTNVLDNLNHGHDIGGTPMDTPTGFLIGVAANPCAMNLEEEVRRFQYKVEAGADFAITQPVFDTEALERFLDRIQHIRVPVLAGIWPLVSYRNAEFMNNEVPGIVVPPQVLERMRAAATPDAALREGLAIAREAIARIRPSVQGLQISAPFGKFDLVVELLRGIDD